MESWTEVAAKVREESNREESSLEVIESGVFRRGTFGTF